jgi:hypothetical protein
VKTFAYPTDWIGFNIPSHSFFRSFAMFVLKNNFNEYDKILGSTLSKLFIDENNKSYIIGIESLEKLSVLNHELCHAFFYTNADYKKSCEYLISKIDLELKNKLFENFIQMGYSSDIELLNDELQAYMSTGIHSSMKELLANEGELIRQFENNFKNFTL